MKKQTLKIKPDLKLYKRLSRQIFPLVPSKIHQSKKTYNRKKQKQAWKKEVTQCL